MTSQQVVPPGGQSTVQVPQYHHKYPYSTKPHQHPQPHFTVSALYNTPHNNNGSVVNGNTTQHHLHHHLPSWLKPYQADKLEENFQELKNPTDDDLMILALELDMSQDEVKTWFNHRQALWRTEQGLPPVIGRIQ